MKIAQCWDDGTINDIKVVEICRKYGAKATFNLNPGLSDPHKRLGPWKTRAGFDNYRLSLDEQKELYQGFNVASHGWKHLNALEVSTEDFLKDAVDAKNYLEDAFQQEVRSYAWPYGTYTEATVKALKEAGFLYGRTTAYTDCVTPFAEPMTLMSNCHFQAPDFWKRYENAKKCGIFYFWGHSYEMADSQELFDDYEDKIRRLSEEPGNQWINVIDIVR